MVDERKEYGSMTGKELDKALGKALKADKPIPAIEAIIGEILRAVIAGHCDEIEGLKSQNDELCQSVDGLRGELKTAGALVADLEKKLREVPEGIEGVLIGPARGEKPVKTEEESAMDRKAIAAACEAYGIGEEHVFSASVYPERQEVVILTNGGAKVTWRGGEEEDVVALDPIQVDGVVRKKMRALSGKKRKKQAGRKG